MVLIHTPILRHYISATLRHYDTTTRTSTRTGPEGAGYLAKKIYTPRPPFDRSPPSSSPDSRGQIWPARVHQNCKLARKGRKQNCNICGSGCNPRRRSPEWSGERGLSTNLVEMSTTHRAPRGARRPPKNPAALNIRPFFLPFSFPLVACHVHSVFGAPQPIFPACPACYGDFLLLLVCPDRSRCGAGECAT